MPKRKRPGEWAVIYAEVQPNLKVKLESRAKRNHRSATAELITILEAVLVDEAADGRADEAPAAGRPRARKGKS